ncbi:MAG: DNA polymerase I [bacterium]|nr:DNA polymerase I [bacterium]
MPPKKTLLLIDAMNLVYKGHFAFIRRPLRTKDGFNTSAIFGVGAMLYKIIEGRQPDYVGVVFEGLGPGPRNELYPDYKANRAKMPDDLRAQIEPVKELVREMGLPLLEHESAEADDVIATLARRGAADGYEVLILSSDKDLMQLVGDGITMLRPVSGVSEIDEMNSDAVTEKMGVSPDKIHDLLALSGDSSDNIPGVKSVGPKTAIKLLDEFGDFEGIYANLEAVKPERTGKALKEYEDDGRISYQLVKLVDDLELDFAPPDLAPAGPDDDRLREFFNRYELRMFLKELEGEEDHEEITLEKVNRDGLARTLRGYDGEYVGVELIEGSALLSVGDTVYSCAIDGELAATLSAFNEELSLSFVTHDSKRAAHLLGPDIVFDFDTELAAYLINPDRTGYELDGLVFEYLRYTLPKGGGENEGALDFGEADIEYSARRARAITELAPVIKKRIAEEEMERVLETVEMPLAPILADMEDVGISINTAFFAELDEEILAKLETKREEIFAISGREFNINSPKQLEVVLFDELGLKSLRKTKTGRSTSADILEKLAEEHPLPALIIEYRQLAKFKGTYVEALPKLVNPATGRIHTTFHQTGAATGRLSSSDPNLQNIPVRTELGARIRKGFIPEPGMLFLSADYSQVELRILAAMGPVENLAEAFEQDKDIHAFTAAEVFDCTESEVTTEQRSLAKAINYGIAYGMGPRKFAQETGVSVKEGKEYIDLYFERYPGVYKYMERMKQQARDVGYVETYFGRRRYLPDIESPNPGMVAAAERMAINTPIQGTAADIMKLGLIETHRRLADSGLDARLLLTIHDELLFEVTLGDVEALTALAAECMTEVVDLGVSLKVNVGVGENWLEAHG